MKKKDAKKDIEIGIIPANICSQYVIACVYPFGELLTYTSFPVPIIERENLESIKLDRTQSFVKMQDIHFYILFNENLLDEEKMEIMIGQKQKDIADIRETMQICKNEYEDYFHRFDVIKRQAVTKENWDKIQKKLQKLEKEKEDIFQNIQQARDTKQSLKK